MKLLRAFAALGLLLSVSVGVFYFTCVECLPNWPINFSTLDNTEISLQPNTEIDHGFTINDYPLEKLSAVTLVFNLTQYSAFFILLILIFTKVLQVIGSLKNWKTFSQNNVHHFRKIGSFLLIIAALTSVGFMHSQSGQINLSFYLPISWLAAALSAFLLAEIFKEGQQLAEEQKLTV